MTANRPRPHIPDSVKIKVAERQLCEIFGPEPVHYFTPSDFKKADAIAALLGWLKSAFGAEKLHLDHDPPLRVRAYNPRIKNVAARYTPNANDANHLLYRTDVDHRFKTNTKGEGAQHPDRVLIKKARRQERGPKPKRTNWPKRKMQGRSQWPKRKFR